MTSNMWNLSLDDGALGNLKPPDEIVAIQCKHLEKITGQKIMAKISPYRLHDDYDTIDDRFEYEFFLTSSYTPNYKYSIMFMNHPIEYYPLTIEVDSDIAKEMGIGGVGSIYHHNLSKLIAENEAEFISMLSKILNSTKVKKVINSLYSMIKSHERKNDLLFGKEDLPF